MREVIIARAGMTQFGRFPDTSLRSLAQHAARDALHDAGIEPGAVDLAVFGNAAEGVLTGQEMVRGQVALRGLGLDGAAVLNVENACASSSSAAHVAWTAVRSGMAEVALVVGAEKLSHPDKRRMIAVFSSGADLTEHPEMHRAVTGVLLGADPAAAPAHSAMMDIYGRKTEEYMVATGATVEDVARVAVKNRRHAAENPRAQYRHPITVDDVLNSPVIAEPLRLLMCSPIADGAAALALVSKEKAIQLGIPLVRIVASVLRSGRDRAGEDDSVVTRAARGAYQQAGITSEDLDVVELHDAAASAELMLYEELGLCGPGEGAKLLASGDTALGGRVPVNPSGGLLSKGHPIGATGGAQLVELTTQLRGRAGRRQVPGARLALAQNGGGNLGRDEAAAVVTILSR